MSLLSSDTSLYLDEDPVVEKSEVGQPLALVVEAELSFIPKSKLRKKKSHRFFSFRLLRRQLFDDVGTVKGHGGHAPFFSADSMLMMIRSRLLG